MRVTQFLADHQVPFETLWHPPAFIASRLAKHLRRSGREVLKSVLLLCSGRFVVAVLPAACQVEMAALREHLGPAARLATDEEVVRLFPDCERGSLVPFGSLYGLSTLLDEQTGLDGWITFQAQRRAMAVRMRSSDFERLEQPQRGRWAH